MNTVIISAGSNIDPFANLDKAEDFLKEELRIVACAKRLTTTPVGFLDQPDFVNTVFLVETDHDPASLKSFLKGVEARLGRTRGPSRFGPRSIDLDIVVFNGAIVDEDVYQREFLRRLILEVSPELEQKLIR